MSTMQHSEQSVFTPCSITAHVKRRNGKLKWWCSVHQASAWGENGERLLRCTEAGRFEYRDDEILDLNLDDYPGGVAAWGATEALLDTAGKSYDRGVHIHARKETNKWKVIDETFKMVRVSKPSLLGFAPIEIHERDAVSYVASAILGQNLTYLACAHCGHIHLDADYFAVIPHRKHLCNACGREFFDPFSQTSISNPLMMVKEALGDFLVNRQAVEVDRRLQLRKEDFPGGIQMWASNPAIIWTSPKLEEAGIHVHAYDEKSRRLVDDTFGYVEINSYVLDAEMVRVFMAQMCLPYLADSLYSLTCSNCGRLHFDRGKFAVKPHQAHECEHCGQTFASPNRKLAVSNPFMGIRDKLLAAS